MFEQHRYNMSAGPKKKGFLASPRTVLLADDDDDLRQVIALYLEVADYAVIACANAQVASEACRSMAAIDLLLTDLQMPDRSGVELARELTGMRTQLPVIIFSASSPSQDLLREVQERGWTFVSKGGGVPALIHAVQQTLPHA